MTLKTALRDQMYILDNIHKSSGLHIFDATYYDFNLELGWVSAGMERCYQSVSVFSAGTELSEDTEVSERFWAADDESSGNRADRTEAEYVVSPWRGMAETGSMETPAVQR